MFSLYEYNYSAEFSRFHLSSQNYPLQWLHHCSSRSLFLHLFHQFFWAYNCLDIICRLCTTETLLAGCLAAVLPLLCHSAAPQPCCPMCTPLSPCCRDHLQLTIFYPVLPAFSFPYSPEVHLCHPYDFVEFQISPNSEHWATSYLLCSLATSVSCLPRLTPWIWPLTLISSIILSHIHLPSAS